MPHKQVPPQLRQFARTLRKGMTEAERRLWNQLRAHRLDSLGFRRQVPIDRYVADFACAEARLIVEIDGVHHAEGERALHDQQRTVHLGQTGWVVLRFWNDDVMRDLDTVCEHIRIVAADRIRNSRSDLRPPLSPAVTSPPRGGRVGPAGAVNSKPGARRTSDD